MQLAVRRCCRQLARLWSSVVQFFASGKVVPLMSLTVAPSTVTQTVVLRESHGEKGTLTCALKSLHMTPRGPPGATNSTAPAPSFTDSEAAVSAPTGCENLQKGGRACQQPAGAACCGAQSG